MDQRIETRNWQSVRTVIEGLILFAVLWIGATGQENTKASIQLQTQMAGLRNDITDLHAQIGMLSAIAQAVARNEVKIEETSRRVSVLEAIRDNKRSP